MMSETTITPSWIYWENVTRTYSGKTGCACGCGGTYTDKYEDTAKVTKRINFMNKNLSIAKIDDFGDEYMCDAHMLSKIIRARGAEPKRHPGYIMGDHWLQAAYTRICTGETEAEVMADYGWQRESR
jgi:hypothetical protein